MELSVDTPLLNVFSRFYQEVKHHSSNSKTLLLLASLIRGKPLHILLADDDRDDQEFFTEAVAAQAPQVKISVADNGEQLMKMLKDGLSPDILFLDLNMPRKDGRECLREIRRDEKLRDLPVIIYSTSSNRQQIDETWHEGANFFLTKPESFGELKKIAAWIFAFDWPEKFNPTAKNKFVLSIKTFLL